MTTTHRHIIELRSSVTPENSEFLSDLEPGIPRLRPDPDGQAPFRGLFSLDAAQSITIDLGAWTASGSGTAYRIDGIDLDGDVADVASISLFSVLLDAGMDPITIEPGVTDGWAEIPVTDEPTTGCVHLGDFTVGASSKTITITNPGATTVTGGIYLDATLN